jgi:hypothetical protein
MKIIVAGFSRTGIYSLQAALAKFGYRSYNFFAMMNNFKNGHLDMWNNFMEGKAQMDWQKLLAGYDAVTDLPMCIYWREMMDAFPDAKVILTTREPEGWWNSWMAAVESQEGTLDRLVFLPRFKAADRIAENWDRNWFRIEPGQYEREGAIARFNEHNEEVRTTVPPEQILEFNVREGWEPLANFLGVSVPKEPFPHENAGVKEIEKKMGQLVIQDLVKFALPYLAGIVVIIVVLILLLG